MQTIQAGSSPLARGTLSKPRRSRNGGGLIPARAGNTHSQPSSFLVSRAHPRSRGEHFGFGGRREGERGSSPLARGTRCRRGRNRRLHGLIPARAGNTFSGGGMAVACGAHPRSRGEHVEVGTSRVTEPGSSPLARGTRQGTSRTGLRAGLIPARAGNTGVSSWRDKPSWAHPRSRGEHSLWTHGGVALLGSSPLARGTHILPSIPCHKNGLIPARAGNTCTSLQNDLTIWAHPRSRGEHVLTEPPVLPPVGSSPLARGTRRHSACRLPAAGLIPARAGNTRRILLLVSLAWAHPRSRGEHRLPLTRRRTPRGSSPLARGTLRPIARDTRAVGLIPARAGNTRLQNP